VNKCRPGAQPPQKPSRGQKKRQGASGAELVESNGINGLQRQSLFSAVIARISVLRGLPIAQPVCTTARAAVTISTPARLVRENYTTRRLAEFTSVKALTAATGLHPHAWPLVIVKDRTDNGIDNAEANGIAPVVSVTVDKDGITVTDNGGGIDIDPDVAARMLDYNTRVSSTATIVSPMHGRQGNASQTIFAIPFALDGERGETIITSWGITHNAQHG
jgi:hypothetical protein